MLRTLCKGKIHRATVTQADLHYIGSITIDQELMEAAQILPFEMVQITNLSTGDLWQTYAIPGPRGGGDICLNGPPARRFQPGDKVIILSLGLFSDEELKDFRPRVVFVDDENRITSIRTHEEPFVSFPAPSA
ncbi:MAG: aspartate 1-decarboxylase [Clostridiales bacterium]|nr:aspartate 1-decarboxylase [Clostridiales bacterium]